MSFNGLARVSWLVAGAVKGKSLPILALGSDLRMMVLGILMGTAEIDHGANDY